LLSGKERGFVLEDILPYLSQISHLPYEQQKSLLDILEKLRAAEQKKAASHSFMGFVKHMWPSFIEGAHHKIMARLFDDVVEGRKKRIIINIAPRHTKSEFASIHLPAYFLGRYPGKKVIMASHTSELAVGFGRKVRGLVDRRDFQDLFPGVRLSADSKAAGRWATSGGGEYFAIGVGGALAGKGADLCIIDDPHSEQDAIIGEYNPEVYQKVMEWYEGGPRQRLQPGGAIIVVMTRWSLRDLTGQLVKKQLNSTNGDTWEIVELPAILPSGNALWPEFWSLDELTRTKNSIPISKWNAQYMQQPTSEEGALIKREYWQDWTKKKPPKCDVIVQAWDTAFTTGTRADYSACTTWGIFYNEDTERNAIILLDAERGKWEFPGLKRRALELYHEHEPDICLIEGRATGQPLIYELRAMGIPVQEVTVGRGGGGQSNDKISRVNSVTDVFASQNVFAPKDKRFAQEVIEECAAFPAGEHDDMLDTVVMAMSRFRQGGWLVNDNDDWNEEVAALRKRTYY
jgi:predicted phage terminase large subunit-like protein